MTRRGLLLAGGATVLAGCGRDDAGAPPPRPVDALRRQLAAERMVVGTLGALRERGVVRRLHARAVERARRLAAAVSEEGGRPHEAPHAPAPGADPARALAAQRDALAAHVGALPDLRERRALAADLIAESATDLAVLAAAFDRPADGSFPGSGA